MSKPVVSILIPSYNSKKYLKDSVGSALNQTYKNIEILLIDDGSTDGTMELFDEFRSRGVQCYRIQNGGASRARNFGLEKAKGDYIQFLDADDILESTKIEKQLALMIKCNADLSYTYWNTFTSNDKITENKFRFKNLNHSNRRTGKELLISFGMNNWFILTIAWLVRKDLIQKAGYWNPVKCPNDDGEYFSRILFWSERVECYKEILAFHRKTSDDSLGKLNNVSKINASFNSFKQIESLLQTTNDHRIMSYPKRLYYMHYKIVRPKFPVLAKRAAKNFDAIKAPSYLNKKGYYWKFIQSFGLYNGTIIYNFFRPIWGMMNKKPTK